MTTTNIRQQTLIFLGLAALMLVTRFHHFGSALHMPDASLAIFFVAGFYLRRVTFFALLGAEAVLIDYVAVNFAGISTWCITPAYGALALSYLVAWAGGYWASRNASLNAAFLLRLSLAGFAASAAGFLIADGTFYWVSGRIVTPNWTGYWSHMTLYFASFVSAACAYIAAAALVQVALILAERRRHPAV